MANQDADLREDFVDGTLRLVENVQKEDAASDNSSSSSDGSNEPNSDAAAPPSILQRPHQWRHESRMASTFPAVSMAPSPPPPPPPPQAPTMTGSSFAQWSSRQAQHQLPILHDPSAAPFGPQEHRFQNLLGQAIGSHSFNPVELHNTQIQKTHLPMNMNWENNYVAVPDLHQISLLSQEQGSHEQGYGFPFNSRYLMRNTVYDPAYEVMGLPIDPHIRMFLARHDNGDPEH